MYSLHSPFVFHVYLTLHQRHELFSEECRDAFWIVNIIQQDLVVMNVTFPDAAGVVGISRPRIKNPRRNEEKDSVDAVETTAKRVAKQSEECLSCIALY